MPESYGERVARARDELGVTQEEFAERVGIPKRTLQDIENGVSTHPQRKTRLKIDAVLGLGSEEETSAEWSSDVNAFLDILGVYLMALPEAERTAVIHDTVNRLATRNSVTGPGVVRS